MQCLRKSVLHEGLINDGFAYQCRNVTSKKKDTEIFKKDFFVCFDSLGKKKFYFVYNEKKNQQKKEFIVMLSPIIESQIMQLELSNKPLETMWIF